LGENSAFGQDLIDWKWSLPENANGAPEAFLVHTDETESLKGHRVFIVVQVGVHELVGWHPLGVSACVLPHVEVSLGLLAGGLISFLGPCGVHVASVNECSTGGFAGELLTWTWAGALASIWKWGGSHELGCLHLEG